MRIHTNGKYIGISRDDLVRVAEQFGIGTGKRVLERVAEAVRAWAEFAAKSKIRKPEIKKIGLNHHAI